MVSLQDLIPLLKMKTATISPPIPSRGKFVNLPAIIEIITIEVEIISEKLSMATASIEGDFIFFAME